MVGSLDAPASTPSHDIDVVVTETGVADLRGLDRAERRRALADLWSAAPAPAERALAERAPADRAVPAGDGPARPEDGAAGRVYEAARRPAGTVVRAGAEA
jgi:acyl-CoA hydrolase